MCVADSRAPDATWTCLPTHGTASPAEPPRRRRGRPSLAVNDIVPRRGAHRARRARDGSGRVAALDAQRGLGIGYWAVRSGAAASRPGLARGAGLRTASCWTGRSMWIIQHRSCPGWCPALGCHGWPARSRRAGGCTAAAADGRPASRPPAPPPPAAPRAPRCARRRSPLPPSRSASRALARRPERSITVAQQARAMSRSSSASGVASVLASILSTRSAGNFWMAASMISWSSSGVARRALRVTARSSHASMPAVSRGSGMGVAMWSRYSFLAARSCAFGSSIVVFSLM